ncbi:MAG: monovalent cation/H+ antiporter complex subunit F [Eubacteriales bacterium]
MEQIVETILIVIMILDALMLCFYLVRAVKGPTLADRLVAVNMIGTVVIIMIAILSYLFQENYLIDICIVYAMISFLATIILGKVYLGSYIEGQLKGKSSERKKVGEEM